MRVCARVSQSGWLFEGWMSQAGDQRQAVQAKERMRAGGWKETSNIRDTEDGIRLGGRVLRIKAGWGGRRMGKYGRFLLCNLEIIIK